MFMKTLNEWLSAYGESHQNKKNQLIHKVCVPVIFFTIVGFLRMIPVQLGPVGLGEVIILTLLCWYLILGAKPLLIMTAQFLTAHFLATPILQTAYPGKIFLALFVLAWIGQFIGHKIEGKKPSFFEDLQFLLIGPLWVVLKR
jgi:uncharacterized membrane protein YGL010W